MRFLKAIFGKKDTPIKSYSDFWKWFQDNEKAFFNVVKNQKNIQKGFFDKLEAKLAELKDGYFYQAGMCDEKTAELILTADGNPTNIAFVEELIEQAPEIEGWKFTALKPALDIKDVCIEMGGYIFNSKNLFFYSNDLKDYPDEINITIIHTEQTEKNKKIIDNGIYIFLDNYLGELEFLNNIDDLQIIDKQAAEKELVPIAKLKDFLIWRQKEFIEKYDDYCYDSKNDKQSFLEGKLRKNGNKIIAIINNQLLNWDGKASHPWIAEIRLSYDGQDNNNMPNEDDDEELNEIEKYIIDQLPEKDGYLYIGRQTGNNKREIYFACKDFRKPSKVFFKVQQDNLKNFEIEYDLYKDKYWKSFKRFRPY